MRGRSISEKKGYYVVTLDSRNKRRYETDAGDYSQEACQKRWNATEKEES